MTAIPELFDTSYTELSHKRYATVYFICYVGVENCVNYLQLRYHVLVCMYAIPSRCSERSRTFHIMLDLEGAAK